MTIGAFSGPRGIKTVGGGAGPPPVAGDDTRVAFALGGILEYAAGVLITGAGEDELTVTGHINIGTAPFAGGGELRLPHASTIEGRNAGNTADRTLVDWGATVVDQLDIGDDAIGVVQVKALSTVVTRVGAATVLTMGATTADFQALDIVTTGTLSVGVTPATGTGTILLGNADRITWRNVANTANIPAINVDGGDNLLVGHGTLIGIVTYRASSQLSFQIGTVKRFEITTALVSLVDATNLSPCRFDVTAGAGGTTASAGDMRIVHGWTFEGRDTGDTADITLLDWGETAADILAIGDAAVDLRINASALDLRIPSPALGGGAGATLGTIGGAGPTVATQNQWLEIEIDGTTHWIPVWV